MIQEKYLVPEYDKRKSFYGKARTKIYFGINNILEKIELYSYNTLVLTLENNEYNLNYNIDSRLLFSNTTLRHIKEFLKQFSYIHNFNINNKQDIIKYNNQNYYDYYKETI